MICNLRGSLDTLVIYIYDMDIVGDADASLSSCIVPVY